MSKRIFVTFFLLIFICSVLSVPAFATELDYNSAVNVVDFLSTDKFTVQGSASGDGETVHEIVFTTTTDKFMYDTLTYYVDLEGIDVKYDELQMLTVNWNPLKVSYSKKLYFYFTTVDASFSAKINGVSYPLQFSHASTLYRAYYLNLPKNLLIQDVSVEFRANTLTFNSAPGIISCFGSNTIVNDFSSGWISGYDYVWYDAYPGQEWSDLISVKKENFMSERLFVPGDSLGNNNYYMSDNDYNEDGYSALTSSVTIVVDLTKLGPDYLDFFYMNYETIGSPLEISSYVFSDFDDRADSALVSLPITNIFSDLSDFEISFSDAEITEVEADGYTCFVDLSSIDIKKYKYLQIGIAIDPIASDRAYNTFSYLGVRSMSAGYTLEHDTFETRLLFNIDTISNYLRRYLSEIAESLSSPAGSDIIMEQGKDAMQQQSSQVNELNNTLDSVPKNDIDIDSLLGNTLTFNPTGIGFLATVTNNKYIIAILTLVFTLALVGYIFFGKR